ncbi:flagellar biosynthesis anti-sigma factor FlgM [Dyella terrae]|nr:flagellar biosynthesis anti-sigma factor FlgM [Dyella terrae]
MQLTDSARALQEAARTTDGATMDTKKVDQIRQALANGTYKVDAGRIADRMMSLDNQLNGKS